MQGGRPWGHMQARCQLANLVVLSVKSVIGVHVQCANYVQWESGYLRYYLHALIEAGDPIRCHLSSHAVVVQHIEHPDVQRAAQSGYN
jgi:hypothetical protein